jgi:hypothetical protein
MIAASLFFSVVVTVMGLACAEIGVAQSSTTQIGIGGLKRNRKRNLFFTCGVPVEKPFLPEAHEVRRDILRLGISKAGSGWSREIAR